MEYLFTSNEWVYYSAILLCAFLAVVVYALQDNYSIAAIGPSAEEYKQRTRAVKTLTFIMIGYVVFWAAIRNGIADTNAYIRSYLDLDPNASLVDPFIEGSTVYDEKAPLFSTYMLILKKMGLDWRWFIASVAIFSGICIYHGVSKYSDDVALSCFLFIADIEFIWLFNGIRQFIVVAMFFAAFKMIAEKKLNRFLLFVFVMYFVHNTAVVLIPIYFIANMKNWRTGIISCVLATMTIVLLFPDRVNTWIDSAFSDYGYMELAENDDGVNIFRVAVALVTPILAFFYRKEISEYNNPFINVMVNFSLITAGLYAVAHVTSGILVGRLPVYTETFNILLLPFIIHRIVPKKVKPILYFCCIVGFFFYFHLQARDGGLYYSTDLFKDMDLYVEYDRGF